MEFNGTGEQQAEYTEEYQTEYAEPSAEYQELIELGLDEQVARELDELFQAGEHFHLLCCSWQFILHLLFCMKLNFCGFVKSLIKIVHKQ